MARVVFENNFVQALVEKRPISTFMVPDDVNRIIDTTHHFRPLHLAVIYSRDLEVFRYLLRNGASLDARDRAGNTPVDLAMRYHQGLLFEAINRQAHQTQVELEKLKRDNSSLNESFDNLTQSLRKKRKLDHQSS